MERNRGFKVIAVIALVLAVMGVSLGFAAFSKNLNINVSGSITPEDNFTIQFADADGAITLGPVAATTGTGSANITGDGNRLANVSATFVAPGDSVVFNLYVTNTSDYIAYLKSIVFDRTSATCTATDGSTIQHMSEACATMTMDISVGTNEADYTAGNITGITTANQIAAKVGTTYSSVPVTLTLTYPATAPTVDGEVTVNFGGITLGYSTSNANAA